MFTVETAFLTSTCYVPEKPTSFPIPEKSANKHMQQPLLWKHRRGRQNQSMNERLLPFNTRIHTAPNVSFVRPSKPTPNLTPVANTRELSCRRRVENDPFNLESGGPDSVHRARRPICGACPCRQQIYRWAPRFVFCALQR